MSTVEDRFPRVEIEGGPHGLHTRATLDGVPMKGVTRLELTIDVRDVVRLKTFQNVRALVAVEAEHAHAVTVTVYSDKVVGETEALEPLATSTADTIWEALYDCARQLELAARAGSD